MLEPFCFSLSLYVCFVCVYYPHSVLAMRVVSFSSHFALWFLVVMGKVGKKNGVDSYLTPTISEPPPEGRSALQYPV